METLDPRASRPLRSIKGENRMNIDSLRPYQEDMYNNPAQYACAVWGRRTGKTTTLAFDACSWKYKGKVAIVAPYHSQLSEIKEAIGEPILNNNRTYSLNPNELRGQKPDIILIEEADYIDAKMIKLINLLIDCKSDLIIKAYGTRNSSKEDGQHFWQTLNLGPYVSISFVGHDILPSWKKNKEQIQKDFSDTDSKAYKNEILSRP